jgi:hypothetical protein
VTSRRQERAFEEMTMDAWIALPASLHEFKVLVRRRNAVRGTRLAKSVGARIAHERRRQAAAGVSLKTLDLVERFLDDRPRCRHCGKPWP